MAAEPRPGGNAWNARRPALLLSQGLGSRSAPPASLLFPVGLLPSPRPRDPEPQRQVEPLHEHPREAWGLTGARSTPHIPRARSSPGCPNPCPATRPNCLRPRGPWGGVQGVRRGTPLHSPEKKFLPPHLPASVRSPRTRRVPTIETSPPSPGCPSTHSPPGHGEGWKLSRFEGRTKLNRRHENARSSPKSPRKGEDGDRVTSPRGEGGDLKSPAGVGMPQEQGGSPKGPPAGRSPSLQPLPAAGFRGAARLRSSTLRPCPGLGSASLGGGSRPWSLCWSRETRRHGLLGHSLPPGLP